jgi:hypothetical protein
LVRFNRFKLFKTGTEPDRVIFFYFLIGLFGFFIGSVFSVIFFSVFSV